jgi:hypothetical protein
MMTPNAHAMNAEGVAKLRSMLAAAASPSPTGSPARITSEPAVGPTSLNGLNASPVRRGSGSGGLSAADLEKMRGMLQQALVSSPGRS